MGNISIDDIFYERYFDLKLLVEPPSFASCPFEKFDFRYSFAKV